MSDDIAPAIDELSASLEVFEGLRDSGRLLPFEKGHIRAIREKIERIED